jgi:hypothetical protein
VRPSPRQLLRVIYHRSDPPGSEARLDACVVRQRPRLRQAGSLAAWQPRWPARGCCCTSWCHCTGAAVSDRLTIGRSRA